jgi:hypothetical protein
MGVLSQDTSLAVAGTVLGLQLVAALHRPPLRFVQLITAAGVFSEVRNAARRSSPEECRPLKLRRTEAKRVGS